MDRAPTPTLDADAMPTMYRSADARAIGGRQRYLVFYATTIGLVLVGGLGGLLSSLIERLTWAGYVTAAVFVAASLLKVAERAGRLEAAWYEGRAAAESVKTLAWRYAVRAAPFHADLDDDAADALLLDRLRDIASELAVVALTPDSSPNQITPTMRRLRALPLAARMQAYVEDRLTDQLGWYTTRALANERRSLRVDAAFFGMTGLAVVGGIAQATGVSVGAFGTFAGVLVVSVTTWSAVTTPGTLARSYGVAALELSLIRDLVPRITTEEDWSRFVEDAEDAISREHTLWRATRS